MNSNSFMTGIERSMQSHVGAFVGQFFETVSAVARFHHIILEVVERRAELMAHVGQELALGLGGSFHFRTRVVQRLVA